MDELGEEAGLLGEEDVAYVLRHGRVLGQRLGADVHIVDEVLDRQPYGHVLAVEDDDGVLAVRGEDRSVLVEEVQQGREQRREEPGQPGSGGQTRTGHEFGGEAAALRIRVEQRGEGTGTLAGREPGFERLAPDRAEDLLELVGRLGEMVVQGVLDRYGGHLAEQNDAARVAQKRVAIAQALDPGGDRRSREGALGREPPPDQGVEDRQRQLDGAPLGPSQVGERTDGLLRQPEITVGVQRNDVAGGDGRREQRNDPFVPLPGVHGKKEVGTGIETSGAELGGEGREDRGVEFLCIELLGAGKAGHTAVSTDPGADGDPRQPDRSAGFGREAGGVGGGEAQASLVRDEPGVAGLVSFEFRVIELGELRGSQRGVIQPGIRGKRRGDLADEVAEGGTVETEQVPGPGEELQRIAEGSGPGAAFLGGLLRGVTVLGGPCRGVPVMGGPRRDVPLGDANRAGGDVPAAVDTASGAEAQGSAVVERQGVGVVPAGLNGRLDDFLVRKLSEHFREQPGGRPVPHRPVQLRGAEQLGRLH